MRLGEAAAAPYRLSWPNVTAGRYQLIARAIDNLGAANDSAPVAVTVGSLTPAAPRIGSYTRQPDGVFKLTFTGEAGWSWQVEISADLKTWTAVTNLVDAAAPVTYTDPESKSQGWRFYRIKSGP